MSAPHQRGAALLTVLLLVAVMTLLVVAMLDDIRFGLRRTGNVQALTQAQWYALGTETLARERIRRLADRDAGRTTLAGGWNGAPFLFPIDGGVIRVRISDATACFNLNSVVEGAVGQWRRRETGVRQYLALLRALDFEPRQASTMADALVDWIDSDQVRSPSGAEDASYAARLPGLRTGGTLLAEASELRAIQGYDEDAYARLRPHACALPDDQLSPVNVNTLGKEDAVILAMLADNAFGVDVARGVIASRPADGWHSLDAFWQAPALRGVDLLPGVLEQASLRTRFFELQTEVEYAGAEVVMSALLENESGLARLVARRWTNDE